MAAMVPDAPSTVQPTDIDLGEGADLLGAPQRHSLGRIGETGRPGETTWSNFICRSSHPVAALFHIGFKTAALVLYVFYGWIGLSYVNAFISVALLCAADFWTVKNVSGRLLVGLRWWVRVKEDGENEYLYESAPGLTVPPLD